MAIHDAYARLTPYELLLPDAGFPDRCFPAIEAEARERGTDLGNPAAFVMLGAVQGALEEVRSEDAGPESVHEHGCVLYFAYHMRRADTPVALVRTETVRGLLAGVAAAPATRTSDDEGWADALRDSAGYVQLPQHLVWIEEGEAPESVDGFFWAADGGFVLQLALVTGMRSDRPGYGVVPVPPQPLDSLPGWAAGPAREGGGDFTTSLPGAELDDLLGIRTPAEVFKLAALMLGRLHSARAPRVDVPLEVVQGPPPSALPYVTL